MLSRTVATPTPTASLSPLAAWQLAYGVALAAGAATLAAAPAPLAMTPQGALAAAYQAALESLYPAQGLFTPAPLSSLGWLNPGADIDASVSTDGEDIAAPVADIAEFRSKDAYLAVDALFGGALAANAAVGGTAVLATALAQDYL